MTLFPLTADVTAGAVGIFALTLGALCYLGYGLSHFLLPAPLKRDAFIWAPLVGYTLMAILFHLLNVQYLDGRRSMLVLFAVATAVNLARLAWIGGKLAFGLGAGCVLSAASVWVAANIGGERSPMLVLLIMASLILLANLTMLLAKRLRHAPRWGLIATLCAVTIIVYFVGIAPLFSIGHLTAIGKDWDVIDIYDAAAGYVIDYPVNAIQSQAPPNPLIGPALTSLSNGWGVTYLQAMSSIVTQHSPIETQSPVMALMHALMVPALFIFFRRTLRLRRWLAVAIASAVGVQALILAMLFLGLGNHIAMLALLPLIFTTTFLALDVPSWRSIVLAAFMLTSIPLTYWTGFSFYIPPVVVYLVAGQPIRLAALQARFSWPLRTLEATSRHIIGGDGQFGLMIPVPLLQFPRLLAKRGLILAGVVAGSVVLAVPGYHRMLNDLLYVWHSRNSGQPSLSQGFGQQSFADISNLTGFAYWVWPQPKDVHAVLGSTFGSLVLAADKVGVAIAFAAFVYSLWCLSRRCKAIMLSFVVGYALVLVYLRFISKYYYAYLKSFTFLAFVFLGLTFIGLHYYWRNVPSEGPPLALRIRRVAVGGVCVLFASLLVVNSALTMDFFISEPQTALTGTVLPESSLRLERVLDYIPAGAPVFISESPPMRAEVVGALSLFLKDHPLFGDVSSIEGRILNPAPEGKVVDFGILSASEDPTDRGYQSKDLLWGDNQIKLYKRGNTVAHLQFTSPNNSRTITQGRPLLLTATPTGIDLDAASARVGDPASASAGQLVVELATFEPQTVAISVNGQRQSLDLTPGLSRYSLESMPLPAQVRAETTGDSPIYVRSINLNAIANGVSALSLQKDVLVAAPTVTANGDEVKVDLRYAGAEPLSDQLRLGMNVGGNMSAGGWANVVWWGFDLQGSDAQLDLNLKTKQATGKSGSEELSGYRAVGQSADGSYSASINFWEANLAGAGWQSPSYTLFNYKVTGGQVERAQSVAPPAVFLPLRYNYPVQRGQAAGFAAEVNAIKAQLPAGADVQLSDGMYAAPQALGSLVEAIGTNRLYADFVSGAQYLAPSHVYDYAIMTPAEDPGALGYASGDRIWSGADFSLYKRGGILAHLDLRQGGDAYPVVTPGHDFSFYPRLSSIQTQEALRDDGQGAPGKRQIAIELASFAPAAARIHIDGQPDRSVRLSDSGLYEYRTDPVQVPAAVTVTAAGATPIYVTSVDVTQPGSPGNRLTTNDGVLLISTRVKQAGANRARLQVQWAGGGDASRLFFSGINANGTAENGTDWFSLGWWAVPMPTSTLHMEIDLRTDAAAADVDGTPVDVSSVQQPLRDGNDGAWLSVWEQGLSQQGWRSPIIKLFGYKSRGGQIVSISPRNTQLSIIRLTPPKQPG